MCVCLKLEQDRFKNQSDLKLISLLIILQIIYNCRSKFHVIKIFSQPYFNCGSKKLKICIDRIIKLILVLVCWMCILCQSDITDRTRLEYVNCYLIDTVPLIQGLEYLRCADCPNLKLIPKIDTLRAIYCWNCPNLKTIEYNDSLNTLWCFACPCLINVPISYGKLNNVLFESCDWLNLTQRKDYDAKFKNRIEKLKILQLWFKKTIMRKRLLKLIPQILPLYYHPNAKGGYLHKRNILYFVEKISCQKWIELFKHILFRMKNLNNCNIEKNIIRQYIIIMYYSMILLLNLVYINFQSKNWKLI